MDPEVIAQLEEQLRELTEMLSRQNSVMNDQISAMNKMAASTKAATDSTTKNTAANNQSSTKYAEAQAKATTETEKGAVATKALNAGLGTLTASISAAAGVFGSLTGSLLSAEQGMAKYGKVADAAASGAEGLAKSIPIVGDALGGLVGVVGKVAAQVFTDGMKLVDTFVSMRDGLVEVGGVLPVSGEQLIKLANQAGYYGERMQILGKITQGLGTSLAGLSTTAGQGAVKFMEMSAVTDDTRRMFGRLGIDAQRLTEMQGMYIKSQIMAGNANELQAKTSAQLRRESLAYVENMTKLSALTGKQAEQLQAEQDVALSEYEELVKQRQENAQIAQLKADRRYEEAAAIKKEQQNRVEFIKEAASLYGAKEAAQLGRMARTGTYDQFTGGLATLGISAGELKSSLQNAASGAEVFTKTYDDINKKTGDMALRAGDALQFMGEEGGNQLGMARGFLEANRQYGDKSLAAAKEQAAAEVDAAKKRKDDVADMVENLRSQERQFQAMYQEFLLDKVMKISEVLKDLDIFKLVTENFSSILTGLVAAVGAAAAASAALAGAAGLAATRLAAGGAAGAAGTAGAAGGLGFLGKAGRFAKGLLGKVALPVMAGMALYDAYQGYNADPNASFGDKIKNAGSSALSGATFGLLGSSPAELAAANAAGATPAGIPGVGMIPGAAPFMDPDALERLTNSQNDLARQNAAIATEQQESNEKLLGTVSSFDMNLDATNRAMKIFREILLSVNSLLGGFDENGNPTGPGGGGMQFGGDQDRILSTIRQMESGNNYTAQNPNSSASGAYQFIDSTWQSLTKKYGIGTEYTRAAQAPANIQDQIAQKYLSEIMAQAGGDVSKIPTAWYTGNVQGKNPNVSQEQLQSYLTKWMGIYNKTPGGGGMGAGMAGPQMGGLAGMLQAIFQMGSMAGFNPMGGMMNSMGLPPAAMAGSIVPLGQALQAMGLRVSENPAFGGVTKGVHKGAGHAEGRAIDVNVGMGTHEASDPVYGAKFDSIAQLAKQLGYKVIWRAPGHDNHMHIEYPGAERGGILSGPNSGYPAMLHGTEMVIPLSNNRTNKSRAAGLLAQLMNTTGERTATVGKYGKIQETLMQVVNSETTKAIKAINETNTPMQNMSTEISNSMRKVMEAHNQTMYELTSKMSEMIDALNTSNDVTKKILKKASA